MAYLAVYICFTEKRSKLYIAVLYFLAITVHQVAIIAIPLVFLLIIPQSDFKNFLLFLCTIWSGFTSVITFVFQHSNIYLLQKVGQMGQSYSEEYMRIDNRYFIVQLVVYIGFTFLTTRLKYMMTYGQDNIEKKYLDLFTYVLCFTWGSFFVRDLFSRLLILIVFMSGPIMISTVRSIEREIIVYALWVFDIIICFGLGAFSYVHMISHFSIS